MAVVEETADGGDVVARGGLGERCGGFLAAAPGGYERGAETEEGVPGAAAT